MTELARPYAAILSARFRTLLQYRAAAFAGAGTQLFWGLIRMMIFEGFYHSTTATQPMSLPQAVTYIWLGQAMLGILPWNVDPDVRGMIRTGAVAYELLRPVDLYALWYSRAVAQRTAPTILRSIPIFLIAGLFFGLQAPPSMLSLVAWLLVTVGAVLLSAAMSSLLTISLLWTVSGEGVTRLVPSLVIALSGMIVPIQLFPEWSQPIVRFLPFAHVVDTPFRVYLGTIPPAEAGLAFAAQLAWTAALALFGRWLVGRAARRLVIQGG
jgi:ABC-2 type transport system permease protein